MSDKKKVDRCAFCDKKKVDRCAFCGRTSNEVEMLLQGGGSSICVDCAIRVSEYVHSIFGDDIFADAASGSALHEAGKTPSCEALEVTPRQITAFLDQYVIGQEGRGGVQPLQEDQ